MEGVGGEVKVAQSKVKRAGNDVRLQDKCSEYCMHARGSDNVQGWPSLPFTTMHVKIVWCMVVVCARYYFDTPLLTDYVPAVVAPLFCCSWRGSICLLWSL